MSDPIRNALAALARHEELDDSVLEHCFEAILTGELPPEQLGAFLMGLAVRGEAGRELYIGAKVMRRHARAIELDGDVLDTCGTGGLGWTSLNTSTASAIVVAACGGRVAKHGNRSVPPKTGSADVLEALGVSLEIDERVFRKCFETANVGFLFARSHHSAMRHVAPVRASLGVRTIFNLLGPLSNPVQASHQILGVYDPKWLFPMAEALRDLGVKRAWVVHGVRDDDRAIDEISIAGETRCISVEDGDLKSFSIYPKDAGLANTPLKSLAGGPPAHNAEQIKATFQGLAGPFHDAISLNAGAGLFILGLASTLAEGTRLAQEAIINGKALETLNKLISASTNLD